MEEKLAEIKVIKRDGTVQDYNEDKLARVCEVLGLSPSQERYLISNVKKKVVENAVDGMIPSSVIRGYVTEELRNIDEYTAEQFEWFYKINRASE